MSKEISGVSPSGTLYARVKNKTGKWWNGSTFETFSSGNYADYVIAMTEEGNSSEYTADFPSAITTGGTYEYRVHRTTSTAAEGDLTINTGKIDWTGTVSITGSTGSMTGSDWRDYLLRRGFKRTDKDTELYEATTDAIQEMRRRFMFDEAEVETTTTDTISVLGDFKLDLESDFGLILGISIEDDDTGTNLIQRNKVEFDRLHASINVESDHGYPRDFCIYAGEIQIGPIPDRTTYLYRKKYSRRAGTITSSTTGVPFTNLYRDILAENVEARLYGGLDKPDIASFHRQTFEDAFTFAQRRERMNAGSPTFQMKVFNL